MYNSFSLFHYSSEEIGQKYITEEEKWGQVREKQRRREEEEEDLHYLRIYSQPDILPSETEFQIVKGLAPF